MPTDSTSVALLDTRLKDSQKWAWYHDFAKVINRLVMLR